MQSDRISVRINRVDPSAGDLQLPQYATAGSAGMDIRAAVPETTVIPPGGVLLIPTGFIIELPPGYEAQIRPRSGLALNHRIGLLNSPGTIDSDYRGEVRIIMMNFGDEPFAVQRGDRIAQMVVAPYTRVTWIESDGVNETSRGAGGFGHTGRH
jgi:dUTP pyrophosphatase